MTPTASYQKFLETFACAHVNDGFMDDNGERMLGNFMRFQGSSLTKVKELKERGNDLFRRNYFDMAAACYDEACKLLGLSIDTNGDEDIRSLSELAVSLNSNLAACALKLEEFQATLDLCSMILNFFPRNVKALFHRALAFMKMKRFLDAEIDLVEALVVEPKNKDVLRELGVVKSQLLMKENGKRMLEVDRALDVDSNKKLVQVSETSVSVENSENVKMKVTDAQNNHGLGMEKSIKVNESVVMEMKDDQNNCGMDLCTSLTKDEHIADKSPIHEFSKKGGGNFRLRIRGQTYQKLLEGKKVSFYHKRDLSTLTIRILYNEKTKETDTTRDKGKKNRRKRRSRKKTMVTMNDDLFPFDINNAKPLVPDTSSSTSSICDNLVLKSSIYQTPSFLIILVYHSPQKLMAPLLSILKLNMIRMFTRLSYFQLVLRCVRCIRLPLGRLNFAGTLLHGMGKSKGEFSLPGRHLAKGMNLQDIIYLLSASRSLTHKFLRPRGVSVSCCRYSSEAHLIRKRKEMFAQLANSDRPLKKPTLIITPSLV